MNTDAVDIALIFAFVICVIVIAFVSALRTAFRAGFWHGVLWEKRRRRTLEERTDEAISETFKSAEWERELDV